MPSFDIVSKYDTQEVTNAVETARKELLQRYDFKGTKTELERPSEEEIHIRTSDETRAQAALEVLHGRLVKRGVSLKFLDEGKPEPAGGSTVKVVIKLKMGIETEKAKEIQKVIKDAKLKVQASIQGDALRVTGKQRDDLQQAIAVLRGADVGVEMQFNNFRD
jgi:uncharacterized protein YajQ (UPF0234 family)